MSIIRPITRLLTCEGFDARALEQASRAVLVVPVVGVPAVVDAIVVLLLDLHVFELRRHRRHLHLAATPPPPPPSSPSTCCRLLPLATGLSNTHTHTHTVGPALTGRPRRSSNHLQGFKHREREGQWTVQHHHCDIYTLC